MHRNTLSNAEKLKHELENNIGNDLFCRLQPFGYADPLKNPTALLASNMTRLGLFSKTSADLLTTCSSSSKLIILDEHLSILRDFFETRRMDNDLLGKLYNEMTFPQFLLRLFQKRYKTIYMDGRVVLGRNAEDNLDIHTELAGKSFIYDIGTAADTSQLYKEYLTLEETMLSYLVLPQTLSVVTGTGDRSEKGWSIAREFQTSIDAAVFSYPAAAEFRDGNTTHYDLLFIAKPLGGYLPDELKQIKHIAECPALFNAACKIYGDKFVLNDTDVLDHKKDYLHFRSNAVTGGFLLHKHAYLTRTKHMLKQVLLAAAHDMEKYQLGTTFQLKGLGLGAFSFSAYPHVKQVEALFIEALKQVLTETKINYIKQINLINMPTTFGILKDNIYAEFTKNGIEVVRSDMNPTTKLHSSKIGVIGGTVFCGDSASMVGNEGNIGMPRGSSDDPATQYSLLDPNILNAASNPHLRGEECLFVMSNNGAMVKLSDYEYQANDNKRTLGVSR